MIDIKRIVNESGIHDFSKSIKIGKIGETIMEYFLKKNFPISSIVSVAQDTIYQQDDIDFIVTFQNGVRNTLEVKTDTYKVNFFYELISNTVYNTPGCMVKTKADIVVYYFINLEVVYFIDRVHFQKWFREHEYDKIIGDYGLTEYVMKSKTLPNTNRSGSGTYNSKGKVFPITFFEEKFDGWYRKYELKDIPYTELIRKALA